METDQAVDSFEDDMRSRAINARLEASRLLTDKRDEALTKVGEANAYEQLARTIGNRRKGNIDYADYRSQTGQE